LRGVIRTRWYRKRLNFEAFPAEYRPALGGFEGDGCFLSTLRTDGASLWTHPTAAVGTFRLALFAVLGVVLELFVAEKELLARGEDKLSSAVYALQFSIRKFHGRFPGGRGG